MWAGEHAAERGPGEAAASIQAGVASRSRPATGRAAEPPGALGGPTMSSLAVIIQLPYLKLKAIQPL